MQLLLVTVSSKAGFNPECSFSQSVIRIVIHCSWYEQTNYALMPSTVMKVVQMFLLIVTICFADLSCIQNTHMETLTRPTL